MYYKTGKNKYDLCSAMTLEDLKSTQPFMCSNSSKTRSYTMTNNKKKIIIAELETVGIKLNDLNWIGEVRTKLKNGTIKKFGYGSFIKED